MTNNDGEGVGQSPLAADKLSATSSASRRGEPSPEWKLVPVLPTSAMRNAGAYTLPHPSVDLADEIYRRMLAASPPSPVGEEMWRTIDDALEWLRNYLENLDDYPEPREAIERVEAAISALKRQSGEG